MFLGFVFRRRTAGLDADLSPLAGGAWGQRLLPAPTFIDRRARYQVKPDIAELRKCLQVRGVGDRPCVFFAIDLRETEVHELRETLVYTLPRVEVVGLTTKQLPQQLPTLLEYYALTPTSRPASVAEALAMFRARHPAVHVLPRAMKSAEKADAFREPRSVLWSLHFLPRVYTDWADARRRNPAKSNHKDLSDLRFPAKYAFQALLQEATFDLSDSGGASWRWVCQDGVTRDFGWHLKWSLAGPRSAANHCRIHYAVVPGSTSSASAVYVGHCGAHL